MDQQSQTGVATTGAQGYDLSAQPIRVVSPPWAICVAGPVSGMVEIDGSIPTRSSASPTAPDPSPPQMVACLYSLPDDASGLESTLSLTSSRVGIDGCVKVINGASVATIRVLGGGCERT